MRRLLLLLAVSAFAQNYTADSTNSYPVARMSFLRSQWAGSNILRDSSLIGYWPMAIPGDKAYDLSGNGLDGTFHGTFPVGGALPYPYFLGCSSFCGKLGSKTPYFNKSDPNYISIPSFTLPTAFTATVWVNPGTNTNAYARIMETSFSTGMFLGGNSSHTAYEFLVGASGLPTCAVSGTITSGAWTMVTGVWSGTAASIYINGGTAASGTQVTGCTTGFSAPTVPTSTMFIGCQETACTTGGSWDGRIQGARLYGRALTAGEILAIYTAENH